MKNIKNTAILFCLALLVTTASCKEDEPDEPTVPEVEAPQANAGADQTVDIEKAVTLDGSSSMGDNITYAWTVTDPSGGTVTLEGGDSAMPSFVAMQAGDYEATVTVTNAGGTASAMTTISVENPTFATADQMGRPAINTVFNFFGDADTKNGYNRTLPTEGAANATAFQGILDALQGYIGLDPGSYTNVLGLDNATTATVLATDVLGSNKTASSTYGPADLNNLMLGQNVLNGRGLADDVVDVTLILAFAGNDLANLSDLQTGLIGDFVGANDKEFLTSFPYLAAPH